MQDALRTTNILNGPCTLDGTRDNPGVVSPILKLRLDGGGEFKKSFQKFCDEMGIEIERTTPTTHEQLARVDRFHRTLRQMIGDEFERTDSHAWFKEMDDIIFNYNHHPNRALIAVGSVSPSEIDPKREEILRQADLKRASILRKKVDKMNFKSGDQVRLLRSRLYPNKYLKNMRIVNGLLRHIHTIMCRYGPNSFLVDVTSKIKV